MTRNKEFITTFYYSLLTEAESEEEAEEIAIKEFINARPTIEELNIETKENGNTRIR